MPLLPPVTRTMALGADILDVWGLVLTEESVERNCLINLFVIGLEGSF